MSNKKNPQSEINTYDQVYKKSLELLAISLSSEEKCFTLDVDLWPKIKEELALQSVLPLVSIVKFNPKLPDLEKTDLQMRVAANIRFFHKLMKAQTDVISLLNANNIPAVVMKGASAAQYYEKPELRMYGDIDLIIPPDCFQQAFNLLSNSGYKNHQAYNSDCFRHVNFKSTDGITIELHHYFSNSCNKKENGNLDNWLYENINNAEHISLYKYDIPIFPAVENGLILLEHINHHLSTGLGLRQVVDWMLYVRSELTDSFWEEKFKERAEAIGRDYLAKIVTKMCQKYLGLDSDITWCDDADAELSDELMLYIMNSGNFGRKKGRDMVGSIAVFRRLSNPIAAVDYLTRVGLLHMSEAGLKPRKSIAWLYQIGYLFLKCFKSNNKKNIVKGIIYSGQDTDLLKRLHVME